MGSSLPKHWLDFGLRVSLPAAILLELRSWCAACEEIASCQIVCNRHLDLCLSFFLLYPSPFPAGAVVHWTCSETPITSPGYRSRFRGLLEDRKKTPLGLFHSWDKSRLLPYTDLLGVVSRLSQGNEPQSFLCSLGLIRNLVGCSGTLRNLLRPCSSFDFQFWGTRVRRSCSSTNCPFFGGCWTLGPSR